MTRLGQTIDRARVAKGLSQDQLAELLKVKQPTVSAWIAGKSKPLPKRFPLMSQVLGVPIEDLQRDFFADDAIEKQVLQHDSDIRSMLARMERLERVIRRRQGPRPGPA